MASSALYHPRGNDFDRFLYACVGEDRNGNLVTVLSAFARLGFDPWQEASDLGNLSGDTAHTRLSSVLSEFPDVPAMRLDHASIAQELIRLLPERSAPFVARPSGAAASQLPSVSIGTILAIALIFLFLVKMLVPGVSGLGK